jgi:hypothetical protein
MGLPVTCITLLVPPWIGRKMAVWLSSWIMSLSPISSSSACGVQKAGFSGLSVVPGAAALCPGE